MFPLVSSSYVWLKPTVYATTIFISILDISRKMKGKMDRKDVAINYIEDRKRSVFFAIVSSVTVVMLL